MLDEEQKQIIREFYEDYDNEIFNKENFDEMLDYLKENTEIELDEEDMTEINEYLKFLQINSEADIEQSLLYWQDYVNEIETNCDYENEDYEVACEKVAKYRVLANKYARFLD